jgi:hypothetical protein
VEVHVDVHARFGSACDLDGEYGDETVDSWVLRCLYAVGRVSDMFQSGGKDTWHT